ITTASPLPSASAGVSYSLTFAVSGAAAPLTWALDSGALPIGLTLGTSTGLLSGAPQDTGTFTFVIRVTDNAKASVTKSFSLTVRASTPAQISTNSLDFFAVPGGDAPAPQSVALITSGAQALSFTIQLDGGAAGTPAPAWLVVRLLKGFSPARIPVAINAAGFDAGKYSARILINTSDGRQLIVTVTLTLTAVTPQLEVSPDNMRFAGPAGALAASEQNLLVRNAGGGGPLAFQATVTGDAPWLRVMPAAGQTGPNGPALLRVLVNAQGLLGSRRAVIHVTSAAGDADIPVALLVRDEGPAIGFHVSGLPLEARAGHGTSRSKSVNILKLGTDVLTWTAEIVSGAEFISLGATSGSATPIAAGALPLSVNPGARKSGNYSGLIKVSAQG